jgi:predicted lipoprotein with Yx(FWY)xxD motif
MARHTTRVAAYGVAAAALATTLAACGSGGSSSGGTQAVSPAAGGSASLTTQSTSIGTVAADSSGRTVYELEGNPASNSMCTSACQAIWPPVMSGGSVKVLHGHPLFTFTGDSAAGQTNGEGVKDTWGTWLAVSPSGTPIAAGASGSTSAPATSPSSSSGGGGYGY